MVEKIDSAVFYKIIMGDAIVGGIEVYRRSETHYHLYTLCVNPELHDRAIGTKVVSDSLTLIRYKKNCSDHYSANTPEG